MASTYFTKLTLYGAAQIAAATAGAPINLVAMAIGDGGGSETTPNDEQIQLVNETYRATLNRLVVDAKAATKLIAELIIPDSVGGWTMREVGIYDDKGKLFAVANTPPSYKPETSEGSAKTQVVRIVIKVSSTANITIFNDPSTVIATVEHVADQFAARTVSAGTGLNGGGSLANDIELSVKYGATAGTAAAGNDPRLVNAILKSMLAQEAGFSEDVPMSQNAVTTFVDHKFGVLQLYIAFNFINNERVKQVTGTSESDLMSQKAVTDALSTKVSLTGNQTISDIKTFSSFPVTPSAAPTATYQAANKKYVDDSAIGVGQSWQDVTGSRVGGTTYTNNTGKPIMVSVSHFASGSSINTPGVTGYVGDVLVQRSALTTSGGAAGTVGSSISILVPSGATYRILLTGTASNRSVTWAELR